MVMASAGVNNMPAGPGAGAEGADPASECRLRRRRRLAPLRPVASTSAGSDESAAAAAAGTPHSSDSSEEDSDGSAAAVNLASSAAGLPADAGAAAVWPVAFGSAALAGRLREMEDTVSLHPSFCVWADGSHMHFFAVFDGHGGPHVAALCREQMHGILATELAAASEHYLAHRDEEGSEERAWRAALSRSFARVDALAPEACACGRAAAAACHCPLSSGQRGAIVGSTAVVALLVATYSRPCSGDSAVNNPQLDGRLGLTGRCRRRRGATWRCRFLDEESRFRGRMWGDAWWFWYGHVGIRQWPAAGCGIQSTHFPRARPVGVVWWAVAPPVITS